MIRTQTALLLSLFVACGCGPASSQQLPSVRTSYNEAIVRSANEQLLLNLVRLRYLHAPQFFEVTAVTTQSAVTTAGSLGVVANLGNAANSFSPFVTPSIGGSVQFEERPTISYQPLQGEQFAERMVRPIPPHTLLAMVDVGWRIDRLLACCVQRINDLTAPVIASDDERFGGERFRRVAELLYQMQLLGALEIAAFRRGEARELHLMFVPTEDTPRFRETLGEIQELLGLDPSRRDYRVVAVHHPAPAEAEQPPLRGEESPEAAAEEDEGDESDTEETSPPADATETGSPDPAGADHIVIRDRSLLGALFYLSHGVVVPQNEPSARSLDYDDAQGEAVDVGTAVPGALLHVDVSAGEPEGAYVRTSYQGQWFAVRDDDLPSKQVFLLLQVLFSVLSASGQTGPLITLPVGG